MTGMLSNYTQEGGRHTYPQREVMMSVAAVLRSWMVHNGAIQSDLGG